MGIAIHNVSASGASGHEMSEIHDLAAAVRQEASGLLGTSVQLADLVCDVPSFEDLFQKFILMFYICKKKSAHLLSPLPLDLSGMILEQLVALNVLSNNAVEPGNSVRCRGIHVYWGCCRPTHVRRLFKYLSYS